MKELVLQIRDSQKKITDASEELYSEWLGKGRNMYQSQYQSLVKKVDDIGDSLDEMYESLVEAEGTYEQQDDAIRQGIDMSREG